MASLLQSMRAEGVIDAQSDGRRSVGAGRFAASLARNPRLTLISRSCRARIRAIERRSGHRRQLLATVMFQRYQIKDLGEPEVRDCGRDLMVVIFVRRLCKMVVLHLREDRRPVLTSDAVQRQRGSLRDVACLVLADRPLEVRDRNDRAARRRMAVSKAPRPVGSNILRQGQHPFRRQSHLSADAAAA